MTGTVIPSNIIIANHCVLIVTFSIIVIVNVSLVSTIHSCFLYEREHWSAMTVVDLALSNKSTLASLLPTSCGFALKSSTLFRLNRPLNKGKAQHLKY